MVADIFKGKIGVYAPDTIHKVRKHEKEVSGSKEDKQMDPADAYFEGFKGV